MMRRASVAVPVATVAAVLITTAAPFLWAQGWPVLAAVTLLSILAARIAISDLVTMTVGDGDVALIALLGLSWSLWGGPPGMDWREALASGLAVFLALAGFSALHRQLRGRDGLGFGDVKLLGASALWIGWFGASLQILVAALAALVFAVLRARRKKRRLRLAGRLPFATFLAPSLVMVWAWLVVQASP
jgi:leader peptidase (prepilin peptidase) / N-methyltransferase